MKTLSFRSRLVAPMLALAGLAAFAPVRPALAQGVGLVPLGDLVYQDVDRLVELGILDSVIVGQRPYTRAGLVSIVRVARERLDRAGFQMMVSATEAARERAGNIILGRLEQRYGSEADGRLGSYPMFSLLDGAALVYTSTDADRRGFPAPHSSPLDASIEPLAEPRLAQPVVRGHTTDLELSQRIAFASWLELYGRERIEYRVPFDTTIGRARGELLIASARAGYRNLLLVVGREPVAWAQGENEGLFFASDGPAIDQVSLRSGTPFTFAGPMRLLGPTMATLVLADLGPSGVRSQSKLLAYKVSIQPVSALELGGTFMNHFGGEGGAKSSFGDRLVDFLPFVDLFRRHNYTDSSRTLDVDSDKLIGIDGRLRIAPLAGMTIAGEVLIDDFDVHALGRTFGGYGSQTVGLTFPRVVTHDVSLRVGAKHMGPLTYTHTALTSGIASRGRLLGEELGPDAKEFNARLRWSPGAAGSLTVEAREQYYSNATYEFAYTDSTRQQSTYRKVLSLPDERRHVVIGTLVARPDADVSLTFRAGGQVVDNYAFLSQRRIDYVASVALRLRQ